MGYFLDLISEFIFICDQYEKYFNGEKNLKSYQKWYENNQVK